MKYISTYFTSFAIVLILIATVNWFIDPFGMFWSPLVDGVNQVKIEAGKRSRISKAYQVNQIKPQILIVGNSRVEMGLDPSNKNLADKTVYNQGMPGASLAMQVDYAIDAMANNDSIEQLIVGVDFLDFLLNEKHRANKDYAFRLSSLDDGSHANIARLKEKLTMVLSLDAFNASINTVFQQEAITSSINPLGFNNALSYVDIMHNEGIKPLFRQKLAEISTRLSGKPWVIKTQDSFPYSSKYSYLGKLILAAKDKNVKITFLINPYHFSYLHTIADNNQWHNFQVWKKALVYYLNAAQDENFILWDFSGASDFVNEAVPLDNPKQQMNWFWEPAHYKKELGDKLLERLLLAQGDSHIDFGVRLTLENIAGLLKKNEASLQKHKKQWKELQSFIK